LGFLRGETGAVRTTTSSLRFYVDRPKPGLLKIVKNPYEIVGWAADLEACSEVKARVVVGETVHHSYPKRREDVKQAFRPVYELPPHTGFAVAPALPVGVHRMRIEVEGGDGSWIPIRRALLFRIPEISRASRRAFSDRVFGFLRGETEAARTLAKSSLRFNV